MFAYFGYIFGAHAVSTFVLSKTVDLVLRVQAAEMDFLRRMACVSLRDFFEKLSLLDDQIW